MLLKKVRIEHGKLIGTPTDGEDFEVKNPKDFHDVHQMPELIRREKRQDLASDPDFHYLPLNAKGDGLRLHFWYVRYEKAEE